MRALRSRAHVLAPTGMSLALFIASGVRMPTVAAQSPSMTTARTMFYDPVAGKLAPDEAGAKSGAVLNPRPVPPGQTPHFVGVHYWIDMVGRGPVTAATSFTTGDRIRLHVRSNVDGFLAVWTFDSDHHAVLLLPIGGDPTGTPIKAASDYGSPAISFAPPAQNESLVLFLARQRSQMPKLSTIELGARALLESPAAKSLKIEVVETINGEIGTYVVNENGGPVAHEIVLQHVAKLK